MQKHRDIGDTMNMFLPVDIWHSTWYPNVTIPDHLWSKILGEIHSPSGVERCLPLAYPFYSEVVYGLLQTLMLKVSTKRKYRWTSGMFIPILHVSVRFLTLNLTLWYILPSWKGEQTLTVFNLQVPHIILSSRSSNNFENAYLNTSKNKK